MNILNKFQYSPFNKYLKKTREKRNANSFFSIGCESNIRIHKQFTLLS